jgi:4-hydroxy-tetrahydrodipicolinate reductase
MATIDVVVHGATGKMGREVLAAIGGESDIHTVAAVCRQDRGDTLTAPDGTTSIPLFTSLPDALEAARPQVMADFTNAAAVLPAALAAARVGVGSVIGSSGLVETDFEQLRIASDEHGVGILVVPNFAIGGVVMMQLVKRAAPYFQYVDIIEMHHEAKIDSPSGTALALAQSLAQEGGFQRNRSEKEPLAGTRGGEVNGVGVHSIRMAGRSAHHEVIFGTTGQTFSLRHDTLGRDCYMPGVLLAIREVVKQKGLVIGLERLLGL